MDFTKEELGMLKGIVRTEVFTTEDLVKKEKHADSKKELEEYLVDLNSLLEKIIKLHKSM